MAKRKPTAKPWTAEMERDFILETLIDLSSRLRKGAGAQGAGVTLTGPECAVLVKKFFKQPIRPDRRRDRHDYQQIALCSFCFGLRGSAKAAVTDTAQMFGVSRATVYAARRKVRKSN